MSIKNFQKLILPSIRMTIGDLNMILKHSFGFYNKHSTTEQIHYAVISAKASTKKCTAKPSFRMKVENLKSLYCF